MKVFDTHWFKKHQIKLVRLANSKLGNYVFQFEKMGHHLEHKIVKITPYSVGELLKVKDDCFEIREHFFSDNAYAQKLYVVLKPLWWGMHVWDFIADSFFPKLSFGFSSLTVNPAAGANTPMDANTRRDGVDETFATIRTTTGNDSDTTCALTTAAIRITASSTSNQFSQVSRPIFCFDTSSLTSSAVISAATFTLTGNGGSKLNDFTNSDNLTVVAATPAATNACANSDYLQTGSTDFGNIAFSSLNNGSANNFSLNASGIANISLTGISKFACKWGWDVSGTFGGVWTSGGNLLLTVFMTDNGSSKPTLSVTYTLGGGIALRTLLGVGL